MMLLNRFVKPSVLEGVNTPNQLIKIELRKEKNLVMVKEVDIGFGASRALTDKSGVGAVETKLAVEFQSDCRKILQKMCEKILERLPLKYPLTKYASSLNPSLIWSDPSECINRFKSLNDYLISANRIITSEADKSLGSWQGLVGTPEFKENAKLSSQAQISALNMEDNCIDMFYKNELGDQARYSDLYRAVKIILIMSHGNAEPERGFSVNKLILKDNLSERS